jgi:hypothetical protein
MLPIESTRKKEKIMPRLVSRQKFIPNGFVFRLPPLKWQAKRMQSFSTIQNDVFNLLRANRAVAIKYKWPTDFDAIGDWIDTTNAQHCLRMGWTDYVMTEGGPSVPKSPALRAQLAASLQNAAATAKELIRGAKTLLEWDESGEAPVPIDQAEARAAVCVACPLNKAGDFTQWFTKPAAELIRRRIEKAQERDLKTTRDDALNLCDACKCPLKLKVHVPLAWIQKVLSADQISRLAAGKDCWILKELQTPKPVNKGCACQRCD